MIWQTSSGSCQKLWSPYGRVNAVAYSPDGTRLLVGTGNYPLSSHSEWSARLELWDLKPEPRIVDSIALPGVSADALVWVDYPNVILCLTGLVQQQSGFLACLDGERLRPLSFHETPTIMVSRLDVYGLDVDLQSGWLSGGLVFFGHGGSVEAFGLNGLDSLGLEPAARWRFSMDDDSMGFACDPISNEVLLADGRLVTMGRGGVVKTLPRLDDCCAVACRERGGYVGVSSRGVVRVWGPHKQTARRATSAGS